MIAQQLINGVVVGSVYALFAAGFTLIFSVQRILNLAHGSVFMWGAFAGLYTARAGLPMPVSLLSGIAAGGLIGLALELLVFRPIRKRGELEFAPIVGSIGASLILISIAQQVSATQIMRFPFESFPLITFQFLSVRLTLLQITIFFLSLLVSAGLYFYLYGTSFGRQIRAVAISQRTAGLLGINPNSIYLQTFFLAGALAGGAGVIIGLAFNSVHFLMGEPFMLRAIVIVVIGGLGSIGGAVFAGLALGVVETLVTISPYSTLVDAVVYSFLFIILLLRPSGLFGDTSLVTGSSGK